MFRCLFVTTNAVECLERYIEWRGCGHYFIGGSVVTGEVIYLYLYLYLIVWDTEPTEKNCQVTSMCQN